MLLLFPRVVFHTKKTMATFAAIPVAYVVIVLALLPRIYALAGYPAPSHAYDANDSMTALLTLRAPAAVYFALVRNTVENSWLIIADTFGLIDPSLPGSPLYSAYFFIIVSLGGLFGFWTLYRTVMAMRRRSGAGALSARATSSVKSSLGARLAGAIPNFLIGATPLTRSLLALAVALSFEGLLMTVSLGYLSLRLWGLYYYGVFCAIFVLIAFAQILESAKPPLVLAAVFCLAVAAATTFVLPATNEAYKVFHYYRFPRAASELTFVFRNRINRFTIPKSNAAALYNKTLALWRARQTRQGVKDIPVELTYAAYELGFAKSKLKCEFNTVFFDVTWNVWGDLEITCHN